LDIFASSSVGCAHPYPHFHFFYTEQPEEESLENVHRETTSILTNLIGVSMADEKTKDRWMSTGRTAMDRKGTFPPHFKAASGGE